MAKIFFNDKVIKHTSDHIILNWFTEKDGKTLFVRDTRKNVYNGVTHAYGEINCYQDYKKDYYVDIEESPVQDGQTVLGLYIAEGTKFIVDSSGNYEPVFIVKEKAFESGLGMQPNTNRKQIDSVVGMGLFHLGAKISIFKGDVRITDELTKDGWIRIAGPKDIIMGIKTTHQAFKDSKKNDQKKKTTDMAAIRSAVNDKIIDEVVFDTFQRREDARAKEEGGLFIFLKSDIDRLKKGKYL